QAAKLGRSVLVVENRLRVGGVSVHTGTIPSKTLRETVLNLSGWRERGFYGLAYRVKKDIEGKDLGARLRMTLDHEIDVLEHQFARNGVRTVAGRAQFLDPHRIAVATPEGENVYIGDKVESVEVDDKGFAVSTLSDGRKIRTEMLLYAAGRIGATANLGLETCGITADDRGRLKVDPRTFQTNVPHIYAAGDVIGFPSLASTSMEQGRIAACHAFDVAAPTAPEYFPYGIYAVPE